MAAALQGFANGANPPIHHVRRCHHIGAGVGMGKRLIDQRLNGDVIENIPVVVDDAVLAMGGERVQRHVRNHTQFRTGCFQGANRSLGQTVRIPGPGAGEIFLLNRNDRKQGNGRDTQDHQLRRLLHQQINTQTLHPRH